VLLQAEAAALHPSQKRDGRPCSQLPALIERAPASAQRSERAHREQSEMMMLVAAAGAATSARSSGTSGDPARALLLSARAMCPGRPTK